MVRRTGHDTTLRAMTRRSKRTKNIKSHIKMCWLNKWYIHILEQCFKTLKKIPSFKNVWILASIPEGEVGPYRVQIRNIQRSHKCEWCVIFIIETCLLFNQTDFWIIDCKWNKSILCKFDILKIFEFLLQMCEIHLLFMKHQISPVVDLYLKIYLLKSQNTCFAISSYADIVSVWEMSLI